MGETLGEKEGMVDGKWHLECPRCLGTGYFLGLKCPVCKGHGTLEIINDWAGKKK